eukprot:2863814-Alexandrium_andersonii.AAC.1
MLENGDCAMVEDGDCAMVKKHHGLMDHGDCAMVEMHHGLMDRSAKKNELKSEQNERFCREADGTVNPIMMKDC